MEERKTMTQEELIEEAKKLAESTELTGLLSKMRALRRQWKRVSEEEESFRDKELSDQFFGYLDAVAAKEAEIYSSVEEKKRDIINKAKEAVKQGNYKKATATMNELMDEWKESGRATKEVDDALWEEFKAVRNEFFANRKNYYEELSASFDRNKEAKEALIERAKEANQLTNFKEIAQIMNDLMEEWKKVGNAGRQHEEELWKAFSAERKAFFKNRDAYYDSLKETFAQRTAAKKDLIAQAKRYLAISEFTDEEVTAVKELRNKWKEIGNAGRDNEETLWKEFNELMNIYFDNMKYYR